MFGRKKIKFLIEVLEKNFRIAIESINENDERYRKEVEDKFSKMEIKFNKKINEDLISQIENLKVNLNHFSKLLSDHILTGDQHLSVGFKNTLNDISKDLKKLVKEKNNATRKR